MNGWNDGISNAIAYMEEHLAEEIDINEVAGKAFVSSFYFQKIFNILCGFTVGEYIRNRRLTLTESYLIISLQIITILEAKFLRAL